MVYPVPTSMDPPAYVDLEGRARLLHWARGALQIVGVGMLGPLVILAIGLPFAVAARLLIELAQWW